MDHPPIIAAQQNSTENTWDTASSLMKKKSKWYVVAYIILSVVLVLYTIAYKTGTLAAIFGAVFIGFSIYAYFYSKLFDKIQEDFLKQFAQSIGFSFNPYGTKIEGHLFNYGVNRNVSNMLSGVYESIPTKIFQYEYTTPHKNISITHNYTVFEVTFLSDMPNIVLMPPMSEEPQNSDVTIFKNIEVGGNFHDYFRVYVPVGKEREAYQIFTPDVMAIFIDKAKGFKFEFIGTKLYIFVVGIISTRKQMQEMLDLSNYLAKLLSKNIGALD